MTLAEVTIFIMGGGFFIVFLLSTYVWVCDQFLWLRAYQYDWKKWWKNVNF